jgi:hypothetical protein
LLERHLWIPGVGLEHYFGLRGCVCVNDIFKAKLWKGTCRILKNLCEKSFTWGPDYTHDVKQLVLVISSTEERDTGYHLGKDAAAGPDIDGCTVCPRAEEDIRCTIPQCHHLSRNRSTERNKQASRKKRTSFEKVLTGTPNALANPKSPNFNSIFRLMSKFWGFRSRCKTWFS